MKITAVVVAVVVGASLTAALQTPKVEVTFDETFSGFKVSLDGVEWLRSGPIGIRDSGQWWTNGNKEKYLLKVVKHLTGGMGADQFGIFDITV